MTIDELVRVFRQNGISLDVNELKCERPGSTEPDATTFGRSGLDRSEEVAREQGDVICRVGRGDVYGRRKVDVVKYPNEAETYLDALNISYSLYPYDEASEAAQVDRVKRALEALVRETPATG